MFCPNVLFILFLWREVHTQMTPCVFVALNERERFVLWSPLVSVSITVSCLYTGVHTPSGSDGPRGGRSGQCNADLETGREGLSSIPDASQDRSQRTGVQVEQTEGHPG